ncbi:MAG TPA: hypothetical protein VIA64_05970 [Burkholderiales bacterium]|jgi:hypothetical protein
MVSNPDIVDRVTLGFVRDKLKQSLLAQGIEPDQREFGSEQSLYAEVENLIQEYGEDAAAIDFAAVKASDELSDVLEALVDEREEASPLTLGSARTAMAGGWLARLTGEGVIDTDEEQSLIAEIDALIERYGVETLAEDVLRFE